MASSSNLAMRDGVGERGRGGGVVVIRVIWRMRSWGREAHELEVEGRGVGEKS